MEVLISSYIMSSVSISHLGVKSGGGWPEQKWSSKVPTFQGRCASEVPAFQGRWSSEVPTFQGRWSSEMLSILLTMDHRGHTVQERVISQPLL